MDSNDRLLTPKEVADKFRVDTKTVSRWAKSGRLFGIKTPGNHWRFSEIEVERLFRRRGQI